MLQKCPRHELTEAMEQMLEFSFQRNDTDNRGYSMFKNEMSLY